MKFETPFCNPGRLSGFYRIYGISRPGELCEDSCTMSRPTEARIHALCWDAIAATEERDVERIIAELREALQEHIKHAQINLSRQAALFRKDTGEYSEH